MDMRVDDKTMILQLHSSFLRKNNYTHRSKSIYSAVLHSSFVGGALFDHSRMNKVVESGTVVVLL